MASHVVVIDATFRRAQVKVTPGTYMSDVMEEACKKLNLKASNYNFKNNNKTVDMSRTFRQTGLTSGAKLELVVASRSPSVVSVALQLPEAESIKALQGRLTSKFASNTTLWRILREFESINGINLNFTGRGVAQTDKGSNGAGRIFYETPVLNVMGRELSSFTDLQRSLAQLGFNGGSVLMKLEFRTTDRPLEEAMAEMTEYFKSTDAQAEPAVPKRTESPTESEVVKKEDTVAGETVAETQVPDSMDVDTVEADANAAAASVLTPMSDLSTVASEPLSQVTGPDGRPVTVYAAPSGDTPKAALFPVNETDYEPTVAHAKLHQQRLLAKSQNVRLLSDAEEEAAAQQKAAKQSSTKQVEIKVRFPDQQSIVSSFNNTETGATLYEFVRNSIVAKNEPFSLGYSGPKGPVTIPLEKRLIQDLGFGARVLVNFNWSDAASNDARKGSILKEEFASKAQEIKVQEPPAPEGDQPEASARSAEPEKKEKKGGAKGGMPKWFKGAGKK